MRLLNNHSIIFLIALSFLCGDIHAQFKTSTPIYASALSPDKSKIAFVDSERISILKTNNFEEIWSIPCNHRTNGMVTEIFFSPNNDSLIFYRASRFNGDFEADVNLIYFSDSLHVANVISRSLQSFPGNVQASFGANSSDYCVFSNFGHAFNFNNQQNWWADGAFLFTKEFENIQFKSPVLKCTLSSDGEKIAILTRSQNSAKTNELQVLDIHTQNIIYKTILPEQNYTHMQFSVGGNSIYLEACRLFSSTLYSNYISDLENVSDTLISINTEVNTKLEIVSGKQEYGLRLLASNDGAFKIINQNSLKENHVFWPNACSLFNIHNAFLLNESEIIVYGSYSDNENPSLSGAANKMKLADVSAFTQIDEKTGHYELFDPNSIRILPNSSSLTNKFERKIVIGENKKLAHIIEGRYLEIWDIENQFILGKFSFENNIDVLADRYDSTLLILEEHEDYNERNIRKHIVNLKTGSASFEIVSPIEAEGFISKNSYSKISDEAGSELLHAVQKNWPWESAKDTQLFETSVSTDNKELLLIDKKLINLKTLEIINVENYSDRILLDNAYLGLSAELCTQYYWSIEDKSSQSKNTYFAIRDIRTGSDTLALSHRFKLRIDGLYKSEIHRSSTSRFVCAYVNEFFKETQRDIYLYDIQKNQVHEFLNTGLSSIQFSASDSLFQIVKFDMTNEGEIKYSYQLYDAYTFKKIGESNASLLDKTFKNEVTSELNSPENSFGAWYISSEVSKKHFGFFPSGKMFVWNFGEHSPFESFSLGTGKPIHCSLVGKNIFVVHDSREAFFINPFTNKVVCTILFIPDGDKTNVLWYLPDGSFYASKNTIPKFHMVKGNRAFPLLNYEVLLNRPDKILAAIGLADSETIEAFGLAYEKRNKKFKNQSLDFKTIAPNLTWKSKIPSETNDSIFTFSVAISGPFSQNLTAHVLINGVPIYGSKGMQLQPNSNEFDCRTTLENGKNEVLVFIQTTEGINSLPLAKEVNCTYKFQRRLFFVGIGVSEYIDSTKNLTYAHSDVMKLGVGFSEAYGDKFKGLVLTNELATRENILKTRNFLQQSQVNDIVVVAFAGHGTIGNNREFYFCPHDVLFKSPENSGVSYAEIEQLLDGIPARKKLLLLDACHSGEIDSSYAPVFVSDIVTEKDKRGIDVVLVEETTGEKQINFLVESLFSNLNNGTGAFVISASAGSEYAFETEQTGGVFTYSFLQSFKTHFYTYSPDPFVTKLQQETYQKVTELTRGAQRPTTRAENTRNDWKFEQ